MIELFQALFGNNKPKQPITSNFSFIKNNIQESYKVKTTSLSSKGVVNENIIDYDKDLCKVSYYKKYKPIKYNEGGNYGG
jgi:hypothetical protein